MKMQKKTRGSIPKDNSKPPQLVLKAKTWLKDSHGLYRYLEEQSSDFSRQTFKINYNCKIYRHSKSHQTAIVKDDQKKDMPMDYIYVASIFLDPLTKKIVVKSADITNIKPHPWVIQENPDLFRNSLLVLRDFKHNHEKEGYLLKAGNFIRLGRLQFLVTEILTETHLHKVNQVSFLQFNKNTFKLPRVEFIGTCRICQQGSSKKADNHLFPPCNCKGTRQLVHINCLTNWISQRVNRRTSLFSASYEFGKFCCNTCNTTYPKEIQLRDGRFVQVIPGQTPIQPYIIIQNLTLKSPQKRDEQKRQLHVIYPQEKMPVKLGRGHESQVKIFDPTVSKVHAEIRFEQGNFYLRDLRSKFGTFIKFREQIEVKESFKIQHRSTCYTFQMTQNPKEYSNMVKVGQSEPLLLPIESIEKQNQQ